MRARDGDATRARATTNDRPSRDDRGSTDARGSTDDATTTRRRATRRDRRGERDVVGTGGDAGAGEPERGLSGGESAERWDKLAVVVADGEFLGGDGVGRRRA